MFNIKRSLELERVFQMRIVSLIVPFLFNGGVKSEATDDEKLWTRMFKRWIRNACEDIASSCINELI